MNLERGGFPPAWSVERTRTALAYALHKAVERMNRPPEIARLPFVASWRLMSAHADRASTIKKIQQTFCR